MRPPAAKEGDVLKTFIVCDGYSTADNNNVRKDGGDEIELTYDQAVHLKKLGVIEVPLEDFRNDGDTKDSTETENGDKADGGGESAVGATSEDPLTKAAG